MLAPLPKLTRGGNDTIQIIVTTACDLFDCSNCTQLLPYRRDTKFMQLAVFREALRSLVGWPGVRAMFGGNPCVHPQFGELCQIMREEVPDQAQRGLWTNNLRGHGPAVVTTFYPAGRFNLNVHGVSGAAAEMRHWLPGIPVYGDGRESWHAAMLTNYRDLGVSEQEWIAKREDCDINQRWSAAIAEREGRPYVYFCEVGASLDGIRGENHGLLAEPGWWRQPMEYFQSQVAGCCDAGCGVPLRLRGHLDQEATYDLTESWVQRMRAFGSQRHVGEVVHTMRPVSTPRATDYLRREAE